MQQLLVQLEPLVVRVQNFGLVQTLEPAEFRLLVHQLQTSLLLLSQVLLTLLNLVLLVNMF
jgi:hypothetical protein